MDIINKTIALDASAGYHHFELNVSVISQDQTQNTTTINYEIALSPVPNTGQHGWDGESPFECIFKIDTASYLCILNTYDGISTVPIASGTQVIQHNREGKATAKKLELNIRPTNSTLVGKGSVKDYWSLPQINRYSTFTIDPGSYFLESPINITCQNIDTTFRCRLSYIVGSATGIIDDSKATTSSKQISWTPPATLGSQDIYNETLSCTLTLVTYYLNAGDEILVGEQTENITLNIPSGDPTFSIVTSDAGRYFDILDTYVYGKSRLRALITNFEGKYAAEIQSIYIALKEDDEDGAVLATNQDPSYSSPSWPEAMEWPCSWVGSVYIEAVVTDTRGRSGHTSGYITVQNYYSPYVEFSVYRCSEQEGITEDIGGDWGKVKYEGKYSLTGSNVATIEIKYKQHSASSSSWTTLSSDPIEQTMPLSGETQTFRANRLISYDVAIVITDKLQSTPYTALLPTAVTLMDWEKNGNAISFGAPLTTTKALEVGWGKIIVDNINSDSQGNTEVRFKRRDYDYQSSLWAPNTTDPGLAFCFFKTGDEHWTYSTIATKDGFYPYHQNTENLGSSSKRWQTIYGNTINGNTITGTAITGDAVNGTTITGTTITGDAVNGTTITGGTVNGNTIKENGTPLINKYAPIVSTVLNNGSLDWNNGSTVASGSWVTVGSYKFPVGRHLIITRVEFAGNASGNRQMMWTSSDTSTSAWTQQSYSTCAGHNGWTNLQSVFYANITTSESKYLRVVQSSGSALETYVYVQIIAI